MDARPFFVMTDASCFDVSYRINPWMKPDAWDDVLAARARDASVQLRAALETAGAHVEMIGAVKGIDPTTGHNYDDTKRYIDGAKFLSDEDRRQIFELNARRIFPRLDALLKTQGR